jgi:transcription elongation factor GreA
MANEILVTAEGLTLLQNELIELETVLRPANADAIREAKAHGDLRENAAYHEAKLNQTRIEQRIAELKKVLQSAKVVERQETGGAHLGSVISLIDLEFDEEFDVTLVGAFEADPAAGKVSISSPMGAALVGATADVEVVIDTPGGKQKYRVKKVV